uniref:C3H1-type domain-containing protein n=1 Tax=Oryza punctata TaxID=4537 RepID=A0A0E0JL71_ORYPU
MSDPFYPYGHGGAGEGAAAAGYSSYEVDLIAARYGGRPLANPSSAAGDLDARLAVAGARRSMGVLYHQPIMGSHSTVEQIEALYSSNTMAKRPRLESSLPIYPQRPGEKDCAFYMMTRTCKFGGSCKFDHPQWVPEGGIPNWKEAANVEESYPEQEGEPDCPFFMKTGKCKFGSKCKFNHPKEKVNALASGKANDKHLIADSSILPVRPSEPLCSFYAKTGKCKFRAMCKFNHPKDIEIPSSQNEPESAVTVEGETDIGSAADSVSAKMLTPVAAAQEFNSKGLPMRPGEVDCPFYMKMGSCKFGSACRFNHPDRLVLNFPLPLGQTILPTPESMLLNPATNFMQGYDFHSAHTPVGPGAVTYPQRPGATVCDFYMKTGFCKFADRCKFHHPIDRSAPDPSANWEPAEESLQLTLAGLPRREDAVVCAFYMKTGVCKFGMQCKFDHPPPQEAIAKVSNSGS